MSETLNLRGDDIQAQLTRNGVLERTLVDFVSGNITGKFTRHYENYLGRQGEKVDEQFDHVEGALLVRPRSQAILVLYDLITQRARRQIAQDLLVVNLVTTLQFPNGDRPKVVVPDLKFGDLPLNWGGRNQYAETPLDFAAETWRFYLT